MGSLTKYSSWKNIGQVKYPAWFSALKNVFLGSFVFPRVTQQTKYLKKGENYLFKLFLHVSKSQYFFFYLNSYCSNSLDKRNLQEQVKKAFCYQKLFWPFTVWINWSSDLKNFANSRPSASNFKSFSRSLEQFFLTVGNKIPILIADLSWWFLPQILTKILTPGELSFGNE